MTAPSRRLESAARRLADQNSAKVAAAALPAKFLAVLDHIDVGAGQKGFDVVWVAYRGGLIKVAGWNVAQTFSPGDRVMCCMYRDQVIVEYAVAGQP